MAYTTKLKVQEYLNTSIKSAGDSRVNSWIASIDSFIDKFTGRSFESTNETRKFDTDGSDVIMIDDLLSASEVQDDGAVITEDSDFVFFPSNSTPKYAIEMIDGYFSDQKRALSITGDWGYSETPPADIELAATILVAGLVNQNREGGKQLRTVSFENYSASFQDHQMKDFDMAINILKQYQRVHL